MHKIESKYALHFCQGQEYQTLFKFLKIKTPNTFMWNGWFKEKKAFGAIKFHLDLVYHTQTK